MDSISWIVTLICIALIYDFISGLNDSANIAASIISSRSLGPRIALGIAALGGLIGPFIFGVAVAQTISSGVALPQFLTIEVLVAASLSAAVWSLITWAYGIPSSSSHALIGGLIGGVMASTGISAIDLSSLAIVLFALFFSPIAGLIFGWLTIKLTYRLLRNATPKVNYFFKTGQIPTAIALASGNGANDSQKTMGIITLGLMATGFQEQFFVPLWVVIICACAKSISSFIGGWRVIKTLGTKFFRIRPIHSFCSQLASSIVIIASSLLGGPVSTTQVVSMSIIGAGAGERISKVRWKVLNEIFSSWLLTIPVTAVISSLAYISLRIVFH